MWPGAWQVTELLGSGWVFMRSAAPVLALLPKFLSLTQKILDDQRALNLVLNSGFVRWLKPPLQDLDMVEGVTRSGLKILVLPNTVVRRFQCDVGYPAETAYIVHCALPRHHPSATRQEYLSKYGVWILRENFQFVEFPGNFDTWLDVITDTRSLSHTIMAATGSRKGSLFSIGSPVKRLAPN